MAIIFFFSYLTDHGKKDQKTHDVAVEKLKTTRKK